MIEAVSCGGIVIYRGKILTLYKSYRNKYEGWVLPKGTVEPGETHEQTAVREVYEESGVHGTIIKYGGKSQYSFYKFHEIYHLLRFSNEKHIVEQAYQEYLELKRANLWKVQPQAQGKYGKLV